MKLVKMKSFWSQLGIKSDDWCFYKMEIWTQDQTWEEDRHLQGECLNNLLSQR